MYQNKALDHQETYQALGYVILNLYMGNTAGCAEIHPAQAPSLQGTGYLRCFAEESG